MVRSGLERSGSARYQSTSHPPRAGAKILSLVTAPKPTLMKSRPDGGWNVRHPATQITVCGTSQKCCPCRGDWRRICRDLIGVRENSRFHCATRGRCFKPGHDAMLRTVCAELAGMVIVSLVPMAAPAQEPPRSDGLLGSVNADPAGCEKTPQAIRRLYIECNPGEGRSGTPDPGNARPA